MDVDMKFAILAASGLFLLPNVALAASPEGNWVSEDGGTKVRISSCAGNKLCAKLVWLNHPVDPSTGKPKTDKLNPDQIKRAVTDWQADDLRT